MQTDEQRETAEQLVAMCRLVVKEAYKLPSETRIKALKTAISDYESALCKRDDRTERKEA